MADRKGIGSVVSEAMNGRSRTPGLRRASGRYAAGASVALTLLLCASCGTDAPIAQDSLADAIASGHAPRILDVRTTGEYTKGHLPGAVHIPYHEIWLRQADIAGTTSDPIVVYCSHGPRAGIAAFQLWTLGYEHVSLLEGQMSGWKRRGLPLQAGSEP
jgi:Rhodanese-related sulfurtransferase